MKEHLKPFPLVKKVTLVYKLDPAVLAQRFTQAFGAINFRGSCKIGDGTFGFPNTFFELSALEKQIQVLIASTPAPKPKPYYAPDELARMLKMFGDLRDILDRECAPVGSEANSILQSWRRLIGQIGPAASSSIR
jgi:hypothetical protein